MEPFTLAVPDADIADLRERLGRTRFPDTAPGAPWAYGTDPAYLRDLVEYWRTRFDWRAQEAALNAFPQFTVELMGAPLHFLRVPGRGPNPLPLLLMHGWPGSVFEFLDIIPRLTDPARFGGDPDDAFTVIAPSLPGYGPSFRPGQRRFGVQDFADCFAALMTEMLGFPTLRRAGRRLGRAHRDQPRHPPPRQAHRHPPQPSLDPPRRAAARAPHRGGAPLSRGGPALDSRGERLRHHPRHPPADPRLRHDRQPGRAGRLDGREVPRLVRQ